MATVRIANGAGFLGDWLDAPRRLVERANVDYLTIEHLAELTMSILARQREKDPGAGYATDFLTILKSLLPALKQQTQLKIVANSGGVNPQACARAAAAILDASGLGHVQIGCVTGDDVLGVLSDFGDVERDRVVTANAYLGARPIAEALAGGARIVITGRVADASLTVGPVVHEFGWAWDDWDRLAGASVAGHLIECGAQVTGGYSVRWQDSPGLADVGYPIAEVADDGTAAITKPAGSGGTVNRRAVVEQLVYEIGDPRHYLTPDVDCDFTTVEVEEVGPDRVAVRGATGRPATDTYKVSLAYRDGWMASGQLLVYGTDCRAKAEECARIVFERCKMAGFKIERTHCELLGCGGGVPGAWFWRKHQTPGELVLRLAAHDARREAVECFSSQLAPLITSGPGGLAGYAAGRPQVRPVFAYAAALAPKSLIQPQVEVRPAKEWAL